MTTGRLCISLKVTVPPCLFLARSSPGLAHVPMSLATGCWLPKALWTSQEEDTDHERETRKEILIFYSLSLILSLSWLETTKSVFCGTRGSEAGAASMVSCAGTLLPWCRVLLPLSSRARGSSPAHTGNQGPRADSGTAAQNTGLQREHCAASQSSASSLSLPGGVAFMVQTAFI